MSGFVVAILVVVSGGPFSGPWTPPLSLTLLRMANGIVCSIPGTKRLQVALHRRKTCRLLDVRRGLCKMKTKGFRLSF